MGALPTEGGRPWSAVVVVVVVLVLQGGGPPVEAGGHALPLRRTGGVPRPSADVDGTIDSQGLLWALALLGVRTVRRRLPTLWVFVEALRLQVAWLGLGT